MDGFDPSVGVIVIAATNRPEVLDPALLRPGRFDRRVAVQAPDTVGRRKILKVHTRSVPLAADVDLDALAAMTAGMVGADLANLVNEAALAAARRGHDAVTMADCTDALEKIMLGSARRHPAERRRAASAPPTTSPATRSSACSPPGADPVRKVSIIPRGMALGVTLSDSRGRPLQLRPRLPAGQDPGGSRRARRRGDSCYDDITTGAEYDIKQATEIARQMVGRWGMSDVIGPVTVMHRGRRGIPDPGASEISPVTQQLVDEEVRTSSKSPTNRSRN